MTQVWERLFVGSLADAESLAVANPAGVTTVISLSEFPVQHKRTDVTYLHLPIEDDEQVPIRQFYRVMEAIRQHIRWGTVLVHCLEGVSRAPSLTAAYMHAVGYRNINAALCEIRKLRPFIHPSTELFNSLRRHLA